jgi:LPPG:FO 2-phospho-L-lactate transferase
MAQQNSVISGKVLALSGGVGGAKLARGLAEILAPEQLTVVANTADDFDYWGLRICPDLDSVMYALADLNDTERGWGLAGETWQTIAAMRRYGGDDWFQLGDQDMATHLFRSQALRRGDSLAQVTAKMAAQLGIGLRLLPMSEQPVATRVHSDIGELAFQEYFVRERCEPAVQSLEFSGLAQASMQADFAALLSDRELKAIIICPSNPFVSVDPILSLPGCRDALASAAAPVIAVSPIVAGLALKGPAAKMMAELTLPASAVAVAEYYQQRYGALIDGFVIDSSDAQLAAQFRTLAAEVEVCPTVMTDLDSKVALGQACLQFARRFAN